MAYTVMMIASAFLAFFKYAVFGRVLPPEQFGFYGLIMSTYVVVLYLGGLGLNESLIKYGSLNYGNGDLKSLEVNKSVYFFLGTAPLMAVGAVLLLLAYFFSGDAEHLLLVGNMVLVAFVVFYFNIINTYLRASQRVVAFSAMLFSKSLVVICVGIPMGLRYGAQGLIFAEAISFSLVLLLAFYFLNIKVRFSFSDLNLAVLIEQIKSGVKIVVAMVLRKLSLIVDRWGIAAFSTMAILGQYTFSMTVFLGFASVLSLISVYFGPRWVSEFARNGDLRRVFRGIFRITFSFGVAALLLWLPFQWVSLFLVENYYSSYLSDDFFHSLNLIYFGSVFFVVSQMLEWLFIAASEERFLIYNSLCVLFFVVLAVFGVGYHSPSLLFFSWVFFASRLISLLGCFVFSYWAIKKNCVRCSGLS